LKLLATGVVNPESDQTVAKAEAQIEAYLKRVERRRKEKRPAWTSKEPAIDPSHPKLQSKVDD